MVVLGAGKSLNYLFIFNYFLCYTLLPLVGSLIILLQPTTIFIEHSTMPYEDCRFPSEVQRISWKDTLLFHPPFKLWHETNVGCFQSLTTPCSLVWKYHWTAHGVLATHQCPNVVATTWTLTRERQMNMSYRYSKHPQLFIFPVPPINESSQALWKVCRIWFIELISIRTNPFFPYNVL